MENSNNNSFSNSGTYGRVMAGVILVIVGVVLFAKQLGVELPYWLFRWEMFLIVLGLFIGAKHSFKRSGWIIPVLIGVFFLLDDWIVDINIKHFFWPTIILLVGATMILSPFKKKLWEKKYYDLNGSSDSSDDIMDTTSILGGVKKNIISKNFKGGQIFNLFGGVEIDLSQSDIDGLIVIDITQIFGGTKLILPAHWELKSEITSILGGVEDKRKNYSALNIAEGKTLIIRGTSVLGGIDIKSF
jgi:predicted membrane protein